MPGNGSGCDPYYAVMMPTACVELLPPDPKHHSCPPHKRTQGGHADSAFASPAVLCRAPAPSAWNHFHRRSPLYLGWAEHHRQLYHQNPATRANNASYLPTAVSPADRISNAGCAHRERYLRLPVVFVSHRVWPQMPEFRIPGRNLLSNANATAHEPCWHRRSCPR